MAHNTTNPTEAVTDVSVRQAAAVLASAGTAGRKDQVDTPNVQYEAMAANWSLLFDLLGGTPRMRAARQKWLPMEDAESIKGYNSRLKRSFLYNAYKDTIEKLRAKPFKKPVSVQGEIPQQLEMIETDVDKTGRTLTSLAGDIMSGGLVTGVHHLLVDFTVMRDAEDADTEGESKASIADEKAAGARPVFVNVPARNLIGWRLDVNGELEQIRILENAIVRDGTYRDKKVKRIRVVTKEKWELFELQEIREGNSIVKSWVSLGANTHTFGSVPLVTIYFEQGPDELTGVPPLEDLAWLNLAHFQSYSDQRNILRVVRSAILFGRGWKQEDIDKGIVVGPRNAILQEGEKSDLKYVEHTGKGIEAGRQDIQDIEARMEVLGLQPLIKKTGNQTATGKAIDEAKNQSRMQAYVRAVESGLEQAYRFAAQWVKVALPSDFKVTIFSDFGIGLQAKDDIDALLKSRLARQITHETFLREIQRRGLISETVDVEAEVEALEDEGPPLAGVLPPDDDDDDEVESGGTKDVEQEEEEPTGTRAGAPARATA